MILVVLGTVVYDTLAHKISYRLSIIINVMGSIRIMSSLLLTTLYYISNVKTRGETISHVYVPLYPSCNKYCDLIGVYLSYKLVKISYKLVNSPYKPVNL